MSRKILSLIVAVAFVLTMVSTAFAATLPSDVTGDFTKSVSKVQALNIMVGDAGTGLFRPSDTIKRSEFAVVAVKAMGLNDTALISAGATKFSDVAADNWASGYINAAVGAGLISGYPDGTYQPDKTINYAEAVTILGNMLGYGPMLAGKAWPSAYVAQANASGVTSGVVMAPTVGASRGNVAKLVSNTLDAKMVYVDSYDINGKPQYKVGTGDTETLAAKKLKVFPVYDGTTATNKTFWVKQTPAVDNSAAINDSVLISTDSGKNANKQAFADGLNPNDYLGMDIKAWYNDDSSKIVATEIQNASSDIYVGKTQADGAKLKLIDKSTSYEAQSGTNFQGYLNSSPASFDAIVTAAAEPNYAVGTVILKDGRVRFANVYTEADTAQGGLTNKTFTVKEVSDGYIKAWGGNVTDIKIQDIKDNATKKTVRYDITKNGKAATIDDIKVGDVVTRLAASAHEVWIVTSTEVKGTLTAVSGTDAKMTLTIGGKDYKVATDNGSGSNMNWSFDNGDTWNKNYLNVVDIIGKDVTVKLNGAGLIANLISTSGSTNYYYGVIRNFAANVGANLDNAVALYKNDGTKVSYIFDKSGDVKNMTTTGGYADIKWSTASTADYTHIGVGDLVQFQLTSDGKIKEATMHSGSDIVTADDGQYVTGWINAHDSQITVQGVSGIITSDTPIFNINKLWTGDDAEVVKFSSIDGVATKYQMVVKNGLAKAVWVDMANLAAGTSGVVVGTGYDADGRTVTVNVAGTVKTYKAYKDTDTATHLSSTDFAYLAAGTWINYNVDSSGKISSFANLTNTTTGLAVANAMQVSTFSAGNVHIVRVLGIDTANKVLHVKTINSTTKMTTGDDLYYRYDPANLDVYDVKGKGDSPVVIKGGLTISNIAVNDYVWLGGKSDAGYQFSKAVILKVDDLNDAN